MADNKLLGCWGVIVGLFVGVFLTWMAFEVMVHFFSIVSLDGLDGALSDTFFHHKAGEWLIITILVMVTYVGVFRGGAAVARFSKIATPPLFLGAALNFIAWLRLPGGTRFATWALILAVVGVIAPPLMSRAGRHKPPPPID